MLHMGDSVGIRELRQYASRVVARVAQGETVTVTDRGRPVARLVPVLESRLEQLVTDGAVIPAAQPPSALPPRLAPTGGQSLSEAIIAGREDRI
jgi:prevent-host-death family protein